MAVILASQSPRRKQLLEMLGGQPHLLLTQTRLAQAQEVGGFHTRPASTTSCMAAFQQ